MQVTLSGPIQAIRGTLDKESGAYFTTLNGKTILCFRRQTLLTPDQVRIVCEHYGVIWDLGFKILDLGFSHFYLCMSKKSSNFARRLRATHKYG